MRRPIPTALLPLALALLGGPPLHADQLEPASVLIYPRTALPGPGSFVGMSVTNVNLAPGGAKGGGATGVRFDYVHAGEAGCTVAERHVGLTPGDTATRLVHCHDGPGPSAGYLVVVAETPGPAWLGGGDAWVHDHLIGSEFVVEGNLVYALPALAFRARGKEHSLTDADGDGRVDFDGIEYEELPDELYLDSFLASDLARIALLDLSGESGATVFVDFVLWNDNEAPLAATTTFECWMERRLVDVSPIFDAANLSMNTPHDPTETDVDCDGVGDLETGWVRIRGDLALSPGGVAPDPAVLGAYTGPAFDGGRPLWHSRATRAGEAPGSLTGGPQYLPPGE